MHSRIANEIQPTIFQIMTSNHPTKGYFPDQSLLSLNIPFILTYHDLICIPNLSLFHGTANHFVF